MRRVVPFVLCLCLWSAGEGRSQERLSAEFSVGLRDQGVVRCWNQATLTVRNPGAPLTALAEVALYEERLMGGPGEPASTYSFPVSLPTGASRHPFAVLLPGRPGSYTVRLHAGGQVVLEDRKAFEPGRYSYSPVTLVLTRRERRLPLGQMSGSALALAPGLAPTDRRAYGAVEVLALDNFALRELPPGAWPAIREWTAAGGLLVLSAPFLFTNAAAPQLREVTSARAGALLAPRAAPELSTLFGFRGGSAPPRARPLDLRVPPPQIVATLGASPVVFEHSLGLGRVRGAGVDPESLVFASPRDQFDFALRFWTKLLLSRESTSYDRDELPASLIPLRARLGWLAKPAGLYLAVFVLVMGPVNLLVLLRLRRREYMVFTAPLAVVLSLAGAVVLAALLHPREPLLESQSVSLVTAGSPIGSTARLCAIYSPTSGTYALEFPDPQTLLRETGGARGAEDYLGMGGGTLPPLLLGAHTTLQSAVVERWAMRAFRYPAPGHAGTVTADLRLSARGLTGSVKNGLGVELHDCVLVHKWNNLALGTLAPGQRLPVALPLGAPRLSERKLARLGGLDGPTQYLELVPALSHATGPNPRGDLAQYAADKLISSWSGPLLLGWGPAPGPAPTTPDPATRTEELHLYLVLLPAVAAGPHLEIPLGGALERSDWSAWLRYDPGQEASARAAERDYNAVLTEFLLPLPPRAIRRPELTVQGRLFGQPGTAYTPRTLLRAYNWRSRVWEKVAVDLRQDFSLAIPHPERYLLLPRGLVRLELRAADSSEHSYSVPSALWMDVAFRGEAAAK